MSVDFCGFLVLQTPWSSRTCQKLEKCINKVIVKVSTEILDDNRKREVELSPRVGADNDIIDLVCSFDFGWQQRGSGNIYNSLSGHGFLVGARSKKVIAVCFEHCNCN